MIARKFIISYLLLLLTSTACGQRTTLGRAYAKQALLSVLSGKKEHNVIDTDAVLVKDSITAISVAEPILFSIYGKNNIVDQRPYETYSIDNYWVIMGTLPKRSLGGTFLIVLNARNNQILRITHGK